MVKQVEELLGSSEAQEILVLREIENRRNEIQQDLRSRLAKHYQYTSRHVVHMEKGVRKLIFYWKMIKPEKTIEKDNSLEYNQTDSQEGVDNDDEDGGDDELSEGGGKKDGESAAGRGGASAYGSNASDSD